MRLLVPVLATLYACSAAPPEPPAGMVLVPGGSYALGGELPTDAPPHSVELEPFFLDRQPVTASSYEAWASGAGVRFRRSEQPSAPAVWLGEPRASAYCHALGKRLPTQSEWEAAARGPDARTYPWGDAWEPERLATGHPTPHPVGQHPAAASPEGLHDLVGNVLQLTASRLVDQGNGREFPVIKGGTWSLVPPWNRAAWRAPFTDSASRLVGFRCAQPATRGDANLSLVEPEPYDLQAAHPGQDNSEALRQVLSYELVPGRTLTPQAESYLASQVPEGAVVADVGAGIGYLSFRLADIVGPEGEVLAVDIDASVLELVELLNDRDGRGNLRTVLSQPDDPALEPGCCDRIFLLQTVHWLREQDIDAFFTGCRTALKPGGELVVIDHGSQPNSDVQAFLARAEAMGLRHTRGEPVMVENSAGNPPHLEWPLSVYTVE
jgi:SAM-dependent methyltransferase